MKASTVECVIKKLLAAHRSADANFTAAQMAGGDVAFAYARIIGQLQGDISIAVIDLGFTGSIRGGGVSMTDGQVFIDAAYGSLYTKRANKKWYIRPSLRHPGFTPGKGADGAKFGDWRLLGESMGPERALATGRLIPYAPEVTA